MYSIRLARFTYIASEDFASVDSERYGVSRRLRCVLTTGVKDPLQERVFYKDVVHYICANFIPLRNPFHIRSFGIAAFLRPSRFTM